MGNGDFFQYPRKKVTPDWGEKRSKKFKIRKNQCVFQLFRSCPNLRLKASKKRDNVFDLMEATLEKAFPKKIPKTKK